MGVVGVKYVIMFYCLALIEISVKILFGPKKITLIVLFYGTFKYSSFLAVICSKLSSPMVWCAMMGRNSQINTQGHFGIFDEFRMKNVHLKGMVRS